MNFSSHQRKLVESIQVALEKDKKNLIGDFQWILSNARALLATDVLDFWLSQIENFPWQEIPITKYGHTVAVDYSRGLAACNRNRIVGCIGNICESLFTYSNDHDMCCMQGDYHYFFSMVECTVYKISELGWLEGLEVRPSTGEYRIALVSELNAAPEEYYH